MLWRKPNKIEIETVDNEATIAYCESLGWEKINRENDPDPEDPEDPGKTPFADNETIP